MSRFRILASSIPLIVAGVFARSELLPTTRPCLALADRSVQIAATPWQAGLLVGFTDDPSQASVRVQIVDDAMDADFAVTDGGGGADRSGCASTPTTRFVAITASPSVSQPVIYLSREDDADYRIFVRSTRLSLREAAALLVGAGDGNPRITTASIGTH